MPQTPGHEYLAVADDVDLGRDRGAPETGDQGAEVEEIVEAGRGPEVDVGVGHDRVDSTLDHLHPRPDAGPPQLGEGDVEIHQVVGVEDDPLRVALAIADAQLMDEGRRQGPNASAHPPARS